MNWGLHIIQNPRGTWQFVGNIPLELAFVYDDRKDAEDAAKFGPHLAMMAAKNAGRTLKTRTFATKEDAEAALAEHLKA